MELWNDTPYEENEAPEADPLGPIYYKLFTSELGKLVYDDLISNFFNQLSYSPGRDPLQMAWHEGQRAVVEYIRSILREFNKYGGDTGN
jgi:hypothetical protein